MEELGLPYELKWYSRGKDRLVPPEYLELHPAATGPVIEDGDKVLTESAVTLEHLCHRYAGGRLTVGPRDPNYTDYLYWMHFNNKVLGMFFARNALKAGSTTGPDAERYIRLIQRRQDKYYGYLDQTLVDRKYLAGPELTCADIMVTFALTELPLFGNKPIDGLKNVVAYVDRIRERPAYARAMRIAGPNAKPPNAG